MDNMSSSPVQAYSFKHPSLGELKGRLVKNDHHTEVIHFRSIPYATVPGRFKPSVLLDYLPDKFDDRSKGDFTHYGAACFQLLGMNEPWFDSYGGRLPDDRGIRFDEYTCLTVTISVPRRTLEEPTQNKLPVMVYVHGGGFEDGVAHVDGLHETTKMVAFSEECAMPVIAVNVGYRLNWFGFLACSDLLEEARQGNADGTIPNEVLNLGLYDQRKAFRWLHTQIGGFGGDDSNVTAFGESAGSISLVYHLCSDEPLFRRAILQSGGPFGTTTLKERDEMYELMLAELGIKGSTPKERLEGLRKVPPEALAKVGRAAAIFPCVGTETRHLFPRGVPSYSNGFELVKNCPWIEDLMIGADQLEGHAFLDLLRRDFDLDPRRFVTRANSIFGEKLSHMLLTEYDIAANMDANLFWMNLTILIGDMFLAEPMHTLANTLAGSEFGGRKGISVRSRRKIYYYRYCLTNPFPGTRFHSVVGHHSVEILYIFMTLLDRYPKTRNRFFARQAVETAKRWIAFANGKEPWDEYVPVSAGGEGKIGVCDDLRGWTVRTRAEDEITSMDDPWGDRRYGGLETLREAMTHLEREGSEEEDKANVARRQMFKVGVYKDT